MEELRTLVYELDVISSSYNGWKKPQAVFQKIRKQRNSCECTY